MSTHPEASVVNEPRTPLEHALAAVRTDVPATVMSIGDAATLDIVVSALGSYEQHRRPEWSDITAAALEQERDDARAERDRARATAVRLEQELAEARR